MEIGTIFLWLALAEHELLLFAGVFLLIGALDELMMDSAWGWLRATGRLSTAKISRVALRDRELSGPAAVFIPAWREEQVIEFTIAYALKAWPQAELRIYVGCYPNDPATIGAVVRIAATDPRVRLVVNSQAGPTTKADCLTRLYCALQADERRSGREFRMVVLHDAEDMVDPAALGLLDQAMDTADFVQLPVLPEPQRDSRWVGSHYCEEFAEAHAKAMPVRSALGAALPAAGVGCAFSRIMLAEIARRAGTISPFSLESLTEDYELGLRTRAAGGQATFLRARGEDGALVATRAYFPGTFQQSVRQKARWVHGISFQGWDRLGWQGGLAEWWMRLRDRRGPFAALVLFAGYLLLLVAALLWPARALGYAAPSQHGQLVNWLLLANFISFGWRAALRFAFTAREYGRAEAARAVLRVPVANLIAILSGRRALFAYVRTLRGAAPRWDKTAHHAHPVAHREGLA
ncbi:conserved hypothetical protein [Altererythrobacter sp. B11]|uniref:glycosyl transferase family protein n=1 Tax=Altererythrobacter sp. B11 TaxID=2060312 RepID=UPI000DC6D7F5|nr:glycosyl transferase family protein [Altererythrobacter sp. B11]BBC74214.1 conserved hypothetical protein [Altererythrobacter sp. B11]